MLANKKYKYDIRDTSPTVFSFHPPHLHFISMGHLTRLIRLYMDARRRAGVRLSSSPAHLSTSLYGLELAGRNPRVVALQHAALRFLERGRRGAAMLVPMGCAVELAAAAAAA